jgi:hypothetical protein
MANCSRNAEPLPISHLLRQDNTSILHTDLTLSSNPGFRLRVDRAFEGEW